MFRLLLRQINKQKIALIIIVLLWIISGYFIFSYRMDMMTRLSAFFSSMPEIGKQDPTRSYKLVRKAVDRMFEETGGYICPKKQSAACIRERSRVIHELRLMQQACSIVPIKHRQNVQLYRPHWLQKRRIWNLEQPDRKGSNATTISQKLVEPDLFWKDRKQKVLYALEDLISASAYAHEISASDVGLPGGRGIILAELIALHARALCMDDIAVLAWGDYAAFLEVRAYRRLQKTMADLDQDYFFPAEKELRMLRLLQNNRRYIRALKEYLSGSPPEAGDPGLCRKDHINLPCAAPKEAIRIYNKLLYTAKGRERHAYRYRLGLTYLLLARRNNPALLSRAERHLRGAVKSYAWAGRAHLNLAQIHILRNDFSSAYAEMKEVRLSGMKGKEYRRTMQYIFIGLGRNEEADCFSSDQGAGLSLSEGCAKILR